MDLEEEKKQTKELKKYGIIAVVGILLLWLGTFLFVSSCKSNEIGDTFGSINALFSGLALAGIIFTVLLQRQELKLQRQELQDTRKEFHIQNHILYKSFQIRFSLQEAP